MKKNDKKREHQIIDALTRVCEAAKYDISGFAWLTHSVNYQHFPGSLTVTCVFTDKLSEQQADAPALKQRVIRALLKDNIAIKAAQISLDNEESCLQQHNGNWSQRLRPH